MSCDSSDDEFFDAESDPNASLTSNKISDAFPPAENVVPVAVEPTVSPTPADDESHESDEPQVACVHTPEVADAKDDGVGIAAGSADGGKADVAATTDDQVDGALVSAIRQVSLDDKAEITPAPAAPAVQVPAPTSQPVEETKAPEPARTQAAQPRRPPPPVIAPYSGSRAKSTKVSNGHTTSSSSGVSVAPAGQSSQGAAIPPAAGISTQGESTASQSTEENEEFVSRYLDASNAAAASGHENFATAGEATLTVVTSSSSVPVADPMSDSEMLEGIFVKNLDTGESIPLSEAEKLIPNGVNPLALHIMRLTSEYVGEDLDAEEHNPNDNAAHAAAVQAEAAAKLVKQKGKLAFKKIKGKVKSVKKALEAHGDNDSEMESENSDNVRFKASSTHRGPPYEFDDLTLQQDLSNEHTGPVWTIRFSTCGRLMASAGQDLTVRVWVLRRAKSTFEHIANKYAPKEEGSDSGQSARSTPDDKLPADDDHLFDPKPFRCYTGHSADILDLAWSKNHFLLSASFDKTVRLWHVSQQACLGCFKHTEFVTGIAFHPRDDRYFLSGSLDARLRLWNIPDKKVALWNEVEGSGNRLITAANFVQNGKYAAAGTYDGRCLLYETEYLKYHTQIHVRSSRGKNARGRKITGIVPMPGEDKILISSNDSRVRLYDLKDLSMVCKYKGAVNRSSQIEASFSSDGSHIISGSENGFVYIWRTYQDMARTAPAARRDVNDSYESFAAPVSCQSGEQVTATAFAPVPGLFTGEGITQNREVLVAGDFHGCIHVYCKAQS